ncbi:MAG: hypothetical protein EOO38_05985 [Cytophagaceae bacterium]|nr:MAG: hypothetical protein EOO38_05985 [Cytophagaceae bacterium]
MQDLIESTLIESNCFFCGAKALKMESKREKLLWGEKVLQGREVLINYKCYQCGAAYEAWRGMDNPPIEPYRPMERFGRT